MKVNSIGLKLNRNICKLDNTYEKPTASLNQISADDVFKYMGAATFISFKGDETKKPTFNETLEQNYFRLPIIRTKKGKEIQALPDKTQKECAEALYNGDNTVCIAPTGTGKTAIANYIITLNNEGKKRTFYTTPLKALSNDKYREFCKLYGEDNVGLLTGDIKWKPNASIVIMTTEIFRNMALDAYAKGNYNKFSNVKTVIFDEAHYISERERGRVWEESIMLMPSEVQILPLSATIGNGKEFANWIGEATRRQVTLVEASPKDRHVPLVYYNYLNGDRENRFQELIKGDVNIKKIKTEFDSACERHRGIGSETLSQRQKRAIDLLYQKQFNEDDDYNATEEQQKLILDELCDMTRRGAMKHNLFSELIERRFKLNKLEAQEITQLLLDSDSREIIDDFKARALSKGAQINNYTELIESLKNANMLPAIVFVFSKKGCNEASSLLAEANLSLTSREEQEQIEEIIDEYEKQGIYLGSDFDKNALLQGVAPHHAGLLPSYRKLVEDLFSKKLLKAVFATSTLSAGINMPAKTVVITSIDKPTEKSDGKVEREPMTSNEFHQMAGRAGRRGTDIIGNVVLYNVKTKFEDTAKKLILGSPEPVKSSYGPSYSFLPAYYEKSENDNYLEYFESRSLRVYQAKNKESEISALKTEFNKCREILISRDYLVKTEKGYKPTTKGKMLTKMHGYNELTLVDSIYNKNLKDLTPVELASFAGAMGAMKQGLDSKGKKRKQDNLDDFINYIKRNTQTGNNALIGALNKAHLYDEELELLEGTKSVRIKTDYETGYFEAAAVYAWANGNEKGGDSVQNFKTINKQIFGGCPEMLMTRDTEKEFEDGVLYSKLSKSIDVLKQILNVSEYMVRSEDCDDVEYYEELIEKAKEAINLVQRPPIYDINAIKKDEN